MNTSMNTFNLNLLLASDTLLYRAYWLADK